MKKSNKILLLVITIMSIFMVMTISSSALTSGDYEYEIISKTKKTAVITAYTGSATKVTIPAKINGYKIEKIGGNAFQQNEIIKSVTIPDGVKIIENYAFAYCTNLANITLPDSIECISNPNPDLDPSGAFCGTAYVNNDANWINGVCYIGNHVYAARATKGVIKIREGTLTINDGWYVAKKVYVPKSVRNIGDYAVFFGSMEDYSCSTIYGYKGTCAETFAKEQEYPFVPRSYTGLYKVDGTWRYVKNGELDNTFTGLVKYSGKWYHVKNGVKTSFNGLVKYNGKWYYVKSGVVNTNYTGLVKHTDGKYYYVKSGVKTSFNGLVKYNGKWYYVKSGVVNTSYTGLVKHTDGKWYYVKKGVKTSYTGTVTYNGKKYKVKNGVKV